MPHLLVPEQPGREIGRSEWPSSLRLLYKKQSVRTEMVLVDPKKVEFNIYRRYRKTFPAKLPDGSEAIITDTSKVV
jgi:S-DNA-T family DNA segregation ATPase FtsK/SpoIIIE